MMIFVPKKAEEEPTRIEMIDSPWFNVVYFDNLEGFDSDLMGKASENTWLVDEQRGMSVE